MRDAINDALKTAIKDRDPIRVSTLRLINAAIKDRDIEERAKGHDGVSEAEILAILAKMIRQREESSAIYEQNGRMELARRERAEIEVIRAFLPEQLSEEEMRGACRKVVDDVNARGLRDMGRCMEALKRKYSGRMDFGKASAMVKGYLK